MILFYVLITLLIIIVIISIILWKKSISYYTPLSPEESEAEDRKFLKEKVNYIKHARNLFTLLNKMGVEWWPTEGTLIGILRYGSNFEKLPSIGHLATDTDIDIMIRSDSDEHWKKLREKLKKEIYGIGFNSYSEKVYNKLVWKLVCGTKDYIGGWDIHSDIHRYIVNEKENYASSNIPHYPFQLWSDKIPYKGVITDPSGKFRRAKFEDIIVPCPFKAAEILGSWNNKEYEKGTLKYPVGGVFKNKYGRYSWYEGRVHKLTQEDKKYLYRIWENLQREGFESFIENTSYTYDVTIISCFIEIKSKHKKNEYKSWMKNLLTYKGPMILFIDSKNYKMVKDLRKDLPTRIIETNLRDLSTQKYKGKFNHKLGWYYNTNMHKDGMNLDEYSMIQCEKPNFLKRAIDGNYFNTPYYMWLDIGYCRYNKLPDNWPGKDVMGRKLKNKIFLMALKNNKCSKPLKSPKMYTYKDPPRSVLVTGGIIVCSKDNIDLLHSLFYNKLDKLSREKKEWAGMDQYILSHIYCENQSLFEVIKAKSHKWCSGNRWFYGIPYFLDQS